VGKEFEFFEHTADIGVRVYAQNIEELFENSAKALFSLITENKELLPNLEREITLEAENLEELLVNWLNELISVFFTYKFLPRSYNIKIREKDPCSLEAFLKGSDYDPYINEVKTEVKAATYHNLKIEKDSSGFRTEIIFDV